MSWLLTFLLLLKYIHFFMLSVFLSVTARCIWSNNQVSDRKCHQWLQCNSICIWGNRYFDYLFAWVLKNAVQVCVYEREFLVFCWCRNKIHYFSLALKLQKPVLLGVAWENALLNEVNMQQFQYVKNTICYSDSKLASQFNNCCSVQQSVCS